MHTTSEALKLKKPNARAAETILAATCQAMYLQLWV